MVYVTQKSRFPDGRDGKIREWARDLDPQWLVLALRISLGGSLIRPLQIKVSLIRPVRTREISSLCSLGVAHKIFICPS